MSTELESAAYKYAGENAVPYSHSVRAYIEGGQELTRMAQRWVAHIQAEGIANSQTLITLWELTEKLEEWSGTPAAHDDANP
jgi:hypothetical protein